jgi:hypothetical protein
MTSPFAVLAPLKERLAEPATPNRNKPMADPPRRPERRDREKPHRPHVDHVRQFTLVGGRPIAIDRRAVSFIVASKDNPDSATVIGMRVFAAKPVPVQTPYDEMLAWWRACRTETETHDDAHVQGLRCESGRVGLQVRCVPEGRRRHPAPAQARQQAAQNAPRRSYLNTELGAPA